MSLNNMKKRALITGVTGQDGSYLAEYLLDKNYLVWGIKRRSSSFNTERVDHLFQDVHKTNVKFRMIHGDMIDATSLIRIIQEVKPDEIYNLAAQSHVLVSFETPEYTANADALGTLRLLEAIRILKMEKKTRFYQASTSEMYGHTKLPAKGLNEKSPFSPQSPYGVAKLYSYWITVNYRQAYGIHASNGILFNHESPVRGETFVTRKITRAVAAIEAGSEKCFWVGNLDAERDWGHARDYVDGMWRILQQNRPDDYVLATGKMHSVRKFIECTFAHIKLEIRWKGSGINEIGIDQNNVTRVKVDQRYFRPNEVEKLRGDSGKAKRKLGWKAKISFQELVKEMIDADRNALKGVK